MRLILTILSGILLGACTKEPGSTVPEGKSASAPATDYERRLLATKTHFQFEQWPAFARPVVTGIFDRLIAGLAAAGEGASEGQKLACFRRAVDEFNDLNRRDHTVIETDEASQLIDVGNHIAIAAGLVPSKYGSGEGPISAGRDW